MFLSDLLLITDYYWLIIYYWYTTNGPISETIVAADILSANDTKTYLDSHWPRWQLCYSCGLVTVMLHTV